MADQTVAEAEDALIDAVLAEARRLEQETTAPGAVADEPLAVADEPLAVADEPLAVADEPLAVADEPRMWVRNPKNGEIMPAYSQPFATTPTRADYKY